MGTHIESALPRPGDDTPLGQIKAALKAAQDRRKWLEGHCPSNALALRAQDKIIEQYRRQISELEDTTWLT